ncbi:hypothetical protein NP233_g3948 [Leucocoprinus birnbaumii]|uniref:Protein kinase domain-containing protein n=1 Tax=Leucocoprinus birnbaumii TaxID=56174 RepID=A0AAD5VVK5_9AGAR|nr:hypothetical protein NP233_g3948 [Leucocoprinus birnbaumii]
MSHDAEFRSLRNRIREADMALKDQSNLLDDLLSMYFGSDFLEIWYANGLYVKIRDVPGSLSGDILRLRVNVPPLNGHSEIIGDDIVDIAYKDIPAEDDDEEDTTVVAGTVMQLPVVAFDPKIHFAKTCRSIKEVSNLLQVQGHPNIVRLLGRNEAGDLVFLRHRRPFLDGSISDFRRLLLQLVDAVMFLHSKGIVHRDLAFRNLLLSQDRQNLILCDLESRYGSGHCPEIALARDNGAPDQEWPYSPKSDVYYFGITIAELVIQNAPRTPWQYFGNFVPPPPFDHIYHTCLKTNPDDRPTLAEIKEMLESIIV